MPLRTVRDRLHMFFQLFIQVSHTRQSATSHIQLYILCITALQPSLLVLPLDTLHLRVNSEDSQILLRHLGIPQGVNGRQAHGVGMDSLERINYLRWHMETDHRIAKTRTYTVQ